MKNTEASGQKLWTLFCSFFKMALFTIGGGYAMLPVMEDEFVKKKKWVKPEDIVDVMAIVQSVPGIIAVNASVFVGYRVAGFRGALAASIGVVAPSFIIIVIIAAFMSSIGNVDLINKAFIGVRAGVCALILLAAITLGKKVIKGKFEWIMTIIAFVSIVVLRINVIILIVGGGIVGIFWYSYNSRKLLTKLEKGE
jgi:chromate transporter